MTDPLVWLPNASGTMPVATAAAEPLDEPPGVRDGSCGLVVTVGSKPASSVVAVLPMMTAPASLSSVTTVQSSVGRRPASSTVPFSVGQSRVSKMSLMPTGTPCSGPMSLPAARASSQVRA